MLQSAFASELEVLTSDLKRIADGDRRTRDFPVNALRIALAEIVARFPVYRSYVTADAPPEEADVRLVSDTVAEARAGSLLPDTSLHDFVADALLGRIETAGSGRPAPDHVARFRRRFQQLTGPVMAKSLEDTLFYRYVPLLSLNEVGGDPGHFGLSVEEFHAANAERGRLWPHAMVASATHDTKRGEDARARIAAIAEDPDRWEAALADWRAVTGPLLGEAGGAAAPDANDQYLILQSLLGAWPFELLDGDDPDEIESFRTRFDGFVDKALREAKRHSSWIKPNEAYEKAAHELVAGLLRPGSDFLQRFRPYARRLAGAGLGNSLARTVLKYTVPGVPDTYQGTAFWDLSLVDPDNRRPVDAAALARTVDGDEPVETLLASWRDGRIKQRVVRQLLRDRAEAPALYADGDYEPLVATGRRAAHVLAFTREGGGDALVAVVARLTAGLGDGDAPAPSQVWDGTRLAVPAGTWRDVLTGREVRTGSGGIDCRELFEVLPVSVLRRIG